MPPLLRCRHFSATLIAATFIFAISLPMLYRRRCRVQQRAIQAAPRDALAQAAMRRCRDARCRATVRASADATPLHAARRFLVLRHCLPPLPSFAAIIADCQFSWSPAAMLARRRRPPSAADAFRRCRRYFRCQLSSPQAIRRCFISRLISIDDALRFSLAAMLMLPLPPLRLD